MRCGKFQFLACLTGAAELDHFRWEASFKRGRQFAAGRNVGPEICVGEEAKHLGVWVGFYGVMDLEPRT
jgi:hypothetical protein